MLDLFKPYQRIDENCLATDVAIREGRKKQVDIAQIKEIVRLTLDSIAARQASNPKGVRELIKRHRK